MTAAADIAAALGASLRSGGSPVVRYLAGRGTFDCALPVRINRGETGADETACRQLWRRAAAPYAELTERRIRQFSETLRDACPVTESQGAGRW